jgi:hypothetical protein
MLYSCIILSPTQLSTPSPPPSHTLPVLYILYFDFGKEWGEKVRRAIVHKAESKIPA